MIYLHSVDDTERFGNVLAEVFSEYISDSENKSLHVYLTGDLGSGKSSIARGFIRKYMNNQNEIVNSPSYLICIEYHEENSKKVFHIDPYRLKKNRNIESLIDTEEIEKNISIVEWPDKVDFTDRFGQNKNNIIVEITIKSGEYGLTNLGRYVDIDILNCDNAEFIKDKIARLRSYRMDDTITPAVLNEDILAGNNDIIGLYETKVKDLLKTQTYIMGIETSCDDTAVAIVKSDGTIISNVVIGQQDLHSEFGGVNPGVAKEAHANNINFAVEKLLQETENKLGIKNFTPDAIAYTIGPGLEICLAIGIKTAMELSCRWGIPTIPTHHIESHIMVSRLPSLNLDVKFPFMTCVVSGGHTFIAYVVGPGKYKLLSTTQDDSMGETIDKVARELGIPNVPGGPELEKIASIGSDNEFKLPIPHIKANPINMSFSGIKFRAIQTVQNNKNNSNSTFKNDFAASFETHIMKYLCSKISKCIQKIKNSNLEIKSLVVAGGVAANKKLRKFLDELGENNVIDIKYPPINLCTDNGVMVAWNGFEKFANGFYDKPLEDYSSENRYESRARWKLWE